MSRSFYHIDCSNSFAVGDQMELEWPGKLREGLVTRSSDENEAQLREMYPNGLSPHGARYAHAALVGKDGEQLPEAYEPMAGFLNLFQNGQKVTSTISPFNVRDEFLVELGRMAAFEECTSRFQSFFAFDELDGALSSILSIGTDQHKFLR